MQVHIFAGREGRYAALLKNDPSALPTEYGPWNPMGAMSLSTLDPDRIGLSTEQAVRDLNVYGRHFFQLSSL